MEGDHNEEEMTEMQMESQIARGGSRTLLNKKEKRANVQIQNSSLIRLSHNLVEKINPPTMRVDKEGGEYQSAQIRKKDISRKEYSGGRGNQAVVDDEHWVVSGSAKSNLIQKERIGHMKTRPNLAIIQQTSLIIQNGPSHLENTFKILL